MKKFLKKITCGIIAAVIMFALVGCGDNSNGNGNSIKIGGSNLEDIIVGTWGWTSSSYDYTFRNDGSLTYNGGYDNADVYTKYEIDGNMLYIYWGISSEDVYEVEILSNDSLKVYEIYDDGTKANEAEYMDRIS